MNEKPKQKYTKALTQAELEVELQKMLAGGEKRGEMFMDIIKGVLRHGIDKEDNIERSNN